MRRVLPSLLLVLSAGCASASSSAERTTDTSIAIRSDASSDQNAAVSFSTSNASEGATVAATWDRVWAAMPQVYATLGLPVTDLDDVHHVIASRNQVLQKIGGKPLSTYFTCGGAYGDNADNGTTYVSLRTEVSATGTGSSNLLTQVQAVSQGAGTSTGGCQSKGTLEKLIEATVQQKTGPAAPPPASGAGTL